MNNFTDREVTKILQDKSFQPPLNLATAAAWIMANFKGENLKIIDVRGKSVLCDFFLLGSAQNSVQADAMFEEVSKQFKRQGMLPKSREGSAGSDWMLLDMGEVIIHVFQENAREIYNLDLLWAEHPTIAIPQEYYFGPGQAQGDQDNSDQYF